MYHSVQIGGWNLYDKWKMVPTSHVLIAPPTPKTTYVDVPGADGALDYTEALTSVKYNDREGSIEFLFLVDGDAGLSGLDSVNDRYHEMVSLIQGRATTMVLEDDPGWTYKGRFYVSNIQPGSNSRTTVTISYRLNPYRTDTSGNKEL